MNNQPSQVLDGETRRLANESDPLGGIGRVIANTSPEATAAIVTDKIAKRGLSHVEKSAVRLKTLKVEYVPTASIKPNTYNPNRQSADTLELLKRSIKEDGFTQPVIVHRSSRQIVDGEHRWRAALDLGMTQIPVVFVDMTDEQMRISTLRHNRARGSEDIELSTEVLRDLQQLGAIGWAQDSLMMSDDDLNKLLDQIPTPEILAGESFVEAWTPERGDAKQGEVAGDEKASTTIQEMKNAIGTHGVAMTKDAAAEVVQRKAALENATTETERTNISQAFEQPYRLQLVFTGEEAILVREVLGEEPAERLLSICREIDSVQ